MFLLKKAFQLRDKANRDEEKPFLEHLEDLRVTITRIVATLMISTLCCYVFKDTLMEVLRRPIEQVWEDSQVGKLPETITPQQWELAKRASQFTAGLNDQEKAVYYKQFDDPKLPLFSECAGYYRAAKSLPDAESQNRFIDALPELNPELKSTLKILLEKGPSPSVDAKDKVVNMRSLHPTETFMLSLKLAFFAGVILAFPFLLIFILQFILPGLKESEKRALWPALAIGFGLFLSGVFFCYFLVLPKTLEFFYLFSGDMGVENEWRIGDYITFTTQFTLIFGLAFELPVIVMVLVKLGLLDYDLMSRTRSYAIVSIFVIAAIITPTGDMLTCTMLAAPMALLYEFCIWFAYFSRKKELEQEAAELARYQPRIAAAPGVIAVDEEDSDDYLVDSDDAEGEGDEHDDGELSDDSGEEEPLEVFNSLRAPYDPFADEQNTFKVVKDNDSTEETSSDSDTSEDSKNDKP